MSTETKWTPPDAIWLQAGDADDWFGIANPDVSWCEDWIGDGDIEYLKATPKRKAAEELYVALDGLRNAEIACMATPKDFWAIEQLGTAKRQADAALAKAHLQAQGNGT